MRYVPVFELNNGGGGGGGEGSKKKVKYNRANLVLPSTNTNTNRSRSTQGKKLCMEEYDCFYQLPRPNKLKIHQLNQIIQMHGYLKLRRRPKKLVINAVESLELMNPSRSSVVREDEAMMTSSSSSSASMMTPEEAMLDLAALDWQDESPITSLQILSLNNIKKNNNNSLSVQLYKDTKGKRVQTSPWTCEINHKAKPKPNNTRSEKVEKPLTTIMSTFLIQNVQDQEGVLTPIPIASIVPKRKRSRRRFLKFASLNRYNNNNSNSPVLALAHTPFTTSSTTTTCGDGNAALVPRRRKRIVRSDDDEI